MKLLPAPQARRQRLREPVEALPLRVDVPSRRGAAVTFIGCGFRRLAEGGEGGDIRWFLSCAWR